MSQRPAKRQRTLAQRDENAEGKPTKVRKPGTTIEHFSRFHSIDKENQSPSVRSKARSKAAVKEADPLSPTKKVQSSSKKGALDHFFQPSKDRPLAQAANGAARLESDDDDAIQDDFSDHDANSTAARKPVPAKGDARSGSELRHRSMPERARALAGNDVSLTSMTRTASSDVLSLPWAESFEPDDTSELAVHKKKVEDVRSWLSNVLGGRERKGLLVLEGPSGAGKSTTIQVLSRELGFESVEWANVVNVSSAGETYGSAVSRFDEFLNRSGTYSSLLVGGNSAKESGPTESIRLPGPRQKVIILEEFPVTLPFREESLKAFRASVLRYLSNSWPRSAFHTKPSSEAPPSQAPVVMIISESWASASASGSDGLTAHRLLGPDLLSHPAVTSIEFNPIAPTMVIKALQLIARKEARQSGRRRSPGAEVLKTLSELGDLRSATGCLEFLCRKGGKDGDWSGRIAATKGGKAAATQTELSAIRTMALRDSTISLFHAAGKVLYNKRITPSQLPNGQPHPPRPPDFLAHKARPNVGEVQVDKLMDETGADTVTFVATLHENYAWSCSGDNQVDELDDCLAILSDSDLLHPDAGRQPGNASQGRLAVSSRGAAEFLLQDDIAFQTAARGLLFSLPYPVKRAAGYEGPSKRADIFKMFYPASLRLWREMERCRALIANATSHHAMAPAVPADHTIDDETASPEVGMRSNGLFEEVVLERLPYLTRISRAQGRLQDLTDLETVTQFRDTSNSREGLDSQDLASRNAVFGIGRPKQLGPRGRPDLQGLCTEENLDAFTDKLVLSDDDIEDD